MEIHPRAVLSKKEGWMLFAAGLGIGIIAGLSVSPVIGIVLTSILGIVTALVAAFREPTTFGKSTVSFLSLLILVTAILLGGVLGIWARTYNILGPDERTREIEFWGSRGFDEEQVEQDVYRSAYPLSPSTLSAAELQSEIDKWVTLGVSKTLVVETLLGAAYGSAAGAGDGAASPPSTSPNTPGFYDSHSSLCLELRNELSKNDGDIAAAIKRIPPWAVLGDIQDSDALLAFIQGNLCADLQ